MHCAIYVYIYIYYIFTYLLYLALTDQRVQQFYNYNIVWLGNYRTVALLTHFYQRNRFVYSINVLNFKGVSSVNTSLSVKNNKTLKALPI